MNVCALLERFQVEQKDSLDKYSDITEAQPEHTCRTDNTVTRGTWVVKEVMTQLAFEG